MGKIKITCDSACDLPAALAERYHILQLPLSVSFGDYLRKDSAEVKEQDFYHYSEQTGNLPEIYPVSEKQYFECFKSYIDQGFQVLHVSLSGQLSKCYENACSAASALPKVAVVDSRSFSVGAGQLALLAAELVSADYRLNELADALNEMKQHLSMSCILRSSEFLHGNRKRGRLQLLGEHIFHLKPEIRLQNGKIIENCPFSGDMESAIFSYVRSLLAGKENIQTDRVFLTYSEVSGEVLERVRKLLRQLQPFEQILEVPEASAVSLRCGPGSLGLAFMTK